MRLQQIILSCSLLLILSSAIHLSETDPHCVEVNQQTGTCATCAPNYHLNHENVCHLKLNPHTEVSYDRQGQWQGACSGSHQSPIDIIEDGIQDCSDNSHFEFKHSSQQAYSIHPAGENLKSTFLNHTQVRYETKDGVHTFSSAQFHWHHPSEHLINGEKFDLEMHIVHKHTHDDVKSYAVVGMLFKVDPTLESDLFDEIDFIHGAHGVHFNFLSQLDHESAFHYDGSLTTPTCEQIVEWFVYKTPFLITQKNMQKMKKAINQGNGNARVAQQLNGRSVTITGGACNDNFSQHMLGLSLRQNHKHGRHLSYV